jgi:Apea-like HEPN
MARGRETLARVPGNMRRDVEPFVIHDLSKPIVEALLESEPFTKGTGFAIPHDRGFSGFYADNAASVLVKRVLAGETPEEAVRWLERFIAIERAVGYSVMALWSVEVPTPIDLGHDVALMPFASLPDSPTKAWYTAPRDRTAVPGFLSSMFSSPPTAAIVHRQLVQPVLQRITDGRLPNLPDPLRHGSLLDDVRLALTLLGPCCPVSAGSWFEFDDPDLSSTGLHISIINSLQDVLPWAFAEPVKLDPTEVRKVVTTFLEHVDPLRASLRLALSRLNQAVRRPPHGDRAIDLAIALESLLVDGAGENTYKVGLRAALLLPVPLEERQRVRSLVSALYAIRSSLMHDGRPPSEVRVVGSGKRPSAEVVVEATTVCASVLRAILEAGRVPHWYSFELAGGASS